MSEPLQNARRLKFVPAGHSGELTHCAYRHEDSEPRIDTTGQREATFTDEVEVAEAAPGHDQFAARDADVDGIRRRRDGHRQCRQKATDRPQ